MRYIITPGQFHKVVYSYLNDINENGTYEEIVDDYGNTKIYIYEPKGINTSGVRVSNEILFYVWYPPGEDDDGKPHDGVGHLFFDDFETSLLGKLLSIRPNAVLDIVADWFTETFDYEVDRVSVKKR